MTAELVNGVLTLLGREVYSDKELSGIRGSRVEFTDGSWLDIIAEIFVNRGPGYLKIDQSPRTGTKNSQKQLGRKKKSYPTGSSFFISAR